jgi:hypothetical protein
MQVLYERLVSGARARETASTSRFGVFVREDERRSDLQDVLVAAGSADHDAVVAQGVDHARRDLDHRYLLARRVSTEGKGRAVARPSFPSRC